MSEALNDPGTLAGLMQMATVFVIFIGGLCVLDLIGSAVRWWLK